MHGELVAIDLETTGLDPLTDAIIEVGAVRLRDGVVIEEYATLVNPERPIPATVTHITGIRSDDVATAPPIQTILPAVRAFIGNAPLIGHNVAFDVGFLQQQGIGQTNPRIDTYDLAAVLLPSAPRYNLNSLINQFGITLEHAHRALDDARAAGLLYWELWNRLLKLPFNTLHEINEAAADLSWDTRIVFTSAIDQRRSLGEAFSPNNHRITDIFGVPAPSTGGLHPTDNPTPLDEDQIEQLLTETIAAALPAYEQRPQQVEMLRAVTRAFNTGQHLLVEAGTGTGKSMAYLLPALRWAVQNNERVVISTNTINLQEQLLLSDLPRLRAALGIDFNGAVMKGRGNYLCPARLTAVRSRRPTNIDELRTLSKILVWLLESSSGDRGEINLRGAGEQVTWRRLSADDESCSLERCKTAMEGVCPFYKARRAAEEAHLLIVNHALLVADARSDNHVLPEYRYLIVDEAHHLEEAVTGGQSLRLDEPTLRRRLADLGSPNRGLLGSVLQVVRATAAEKDIARTEPFIETLHDAANFMQTHIGKLFQALQAFAIDTGDGRPLDPSTSIRVTTKLRGRTSFAQIQNAWQTLSEFFEVISDGMNQLTRWLERLKANDRAAYETLISSTAALARYLDEMRSILSSFATTPDPNLIYWLYIGRENDSLALHTAPLHIGGMINDLLWATKETVVLTSATLQTGDTFDYIRERLHTDDFETLTLGSPFDYHQSTLLYVPTDFPDPSERVKYQRAVEQGLIELAAALDGRMMALFTSYTQLRQTAQAITPRLALGNITVYDQSDGSSRQALLDGFRSTERAVLLATRSFWEGVDLPGEQLSALVIVRLPFTVPTDPVFAARSETYSNSFNDYALPDALLRFRQGFGRLIRTQTDRGVVVIFDSRVLTKNYGSSFIAALPDCTTQQGTLQALPEAARKWLESAKV
jgi:DNA polymerase-3 subunit epsilon/ATP-dependent DNA helicase DinG